MKLVVSKGDKGIGLGPWTVKDSSGTVVDLTDYTITFKVWTDGSSDSPTVEQACTKDDAEAGECSYTIQAADFDTAGDYLWELELTKTGVQWSSPASALTVEDSA